MWTVFRSSTCWRTAVFCFTLLAIGLSYYRFQTTIKPSGYDGLVREDDAEYKDRKATLLTACDGNVNKYLSHKTALDNIAVDEKHRLLYCAIPKVASTFWKRVFQLSSGVKSSSSVFEIKNAHDNSLKMLKSYLPDVKFWVLKNYTTFLFVREPYSRLLACYIDKFFTNNPMFWSIGKVIVRNHRQNPTPLALSCGHDVTFSEFIKHVIRTVETKSGVNEHWMPMYQKCGPCQVQYDLIGKMETFSQDLAYILENHLGGSINFNNMETESEINRLTKNTHGLFQRYTTKAKQCMPLVEAIERLLKKEQVRGIISKSVILPESFRMSTNISEEQVLEFILKAYNESMKDSDRKKNRKEALIEAYSTVPTEDMIKLQQLYKPDFDIFGYNPQPESLHRKTTNHGNTNKFYFS